MQADDTEGCIGGERNIDIALCHVAVSAARNRIGRQIKASLKTFGIWLFSDDTQVARLRSHAIEGALRPHQHLDPLYIVYVNIQVQTNSRHWLLI